MSLQKKIFIYSILFFIYLITPILSEDENFYRCTDGIVAKDEEYCPTTMSCPDGLIKTNSYTCSYDDGFAPKSKCATDLECWNGECVSKKSELLDLCPSSISCPPNLVTKCPDNSCAANIDECPQYSDCPQFLPIRCGNGDCRKTLSDCPSLIHCPDEKRILCNDGSCRAMKEQCAIPTEKTTCDDKSMTRCADGTCTNSKFLCPTMMTCPVGYEKCWDGNCALKGTCSNKKLYDVCNSNTKILCQFDFSCATEIDSCPTGIICPIEKPVKCWDNSCRDSIENCPPYQSCPSGLTECPDGSCGIGTSIAVCGTHIKCSDDAPYRCFDNTCRRNPDDCPTQPSCPEDTPILCWDGRCLAERGECLSPDKCDEINPVRCPNGLCSKSSANCKEETDCPSEFTRCKDGSCRKKLADCPDEECPVNLPFKCNNGFCMSDEKYCDKDNACPFNLPIKCSDGSCAANEANCPEKPECPTGQKLCPDGSCLGNNVVCPASNGCPVDTPFRCADGECINIKKSSCSIPKCDSSIPIKCFDGTCALTVNYCPIERKISDSGYVICADGTEAPSYDECKPLVSCGEGEIRCNDGTCRQTKEECPKANTCPNGEIRCENGSCATESNKCPAANGCPLITPYKCPSSGLCVKDLDECDSESEVAESNGCPVERPIKCSKYNNCVANRDDCNELESNCPSGTTMCPDGECVDDLDKCSDNIICDEEKGKGILCGTEQDICAKTLGDCYNSLNCKVDTPFRCPNGDCKRYPSKLGGVNGCDIAISCPSYKPYLCADGSCEEKSSFCKSYSPCSEDKPYLCTDKTCASTKSECEKNHEKCPSRSPMLCPNGNCVSGIFDCQDSRCPSWNSYYCILGKCRNTPRECQKIQSEYVFDEGGEITNITKILSTVCKSSEFTCIDGTCRESADQCPMYTGCVSSEAPYKCLDGGCAKDKDSCENKNDKTKFECPENTVLCEDGICRNDCSLVEYNGCPNENPLMCSNGRCVTKAIECVGESACDSTEKPFRCIDGTCATSLAECKVAFREVGSTNVRLSIFPKMEISSDIIIGPGNIAAGKIEIPAESIKKTSDGSSAETQINLRSIVRSKITDTYTSYNETRHDDLKLVFPYADESNNYTLSYQYSVLSSAIEIKLLDPDNTKITGKILLTLLFDFPYKHPKLSTENTISYESSENSSETNSTKRYTSLPLHYSRDVCLGKLNTQLRKWECNGLNFNVLEKNNLQLTGEINEDGIYAVIMNLKINDNKLYINQNWIISNLKVIVIVLAVLLVVIIVVVYIFLRILRYRVKYKGTKEIYKGFELELTDLQDKSIEGRQGQTLADVKEGIIYTDNVAFKSQVDNEARKKNTQLEKIFDGYTKKLRLLERNNALLKGQYDSIKNEYNRLNEYKASLKEGDKVKINVNEIKLNENAENAENAE